MSIDMRNSSLLLRFLLNRRVLGLTFVLALILLLLSITMMPNLYSQPSLLSTNPFTAHTNPDVVSEVLHSILAKIAREIQEIRELSTESATDQSELKGERIRYLAFLNDILELMGSLKVLLPVGQEATTRVALAHPLSRSSENYNDVVEFFLVEEIRKYARIKPNRLGKQNFMGANGTFTSIGHACFSMKEELEEYMDYDVGDLCNDDWKKAQKLMVHGCDPLPRRRCLSRAPKLYTKPKPINESMWELPDDRNVLWSQYKCKNFASLAKNTTGKGFFKCADCFNLTHHESPRWMKAAYIDPVSNLTTDFLLEDVMAIKPREIRIGLDFSAGTGTFAARMREMFNATIATGTINFGAPFSEVISLRGLLPLYLTINQRLPFFDNTLDIIHTTRFLDGWIDFVLLDFVLYDWDRVLRPGGLLWIDSFFCAKTDLDDYLDTFERLRYKRHRWVIVPKLDKDGEEMFFSAVLEKPPRPF